MAFTFRDGRNVLEKNFNPYHNVVAHASHGYDGLVKQVACVLNLNSRVGIKV